MKVNYQVVNKVLMNHHTIFDIDFEGEKNVMYEEKEKRDNEPEENSYDSSKEEVVYNDGPNNDHIEMAMYKAICDNIKDTLSQIKSYSKVTLMSDPKASYFTIVDAVLSGPKHIDPDDLISVLGKSGYLVEIPI